MRRARYRILIGLVLITAAAAAIPVYSYVRGIIGMYYWGRTEVKDVTSQPYYHGGFRVGVIYRLKHGVYLSEPQGRRKVVALQPPARYGVEGLAAALRRYGAANKIPDSPELSPGVESKGPPPVESLHAGEVPPPYVAVVPRGTRLRVDQVLLVTSGDSSGLDIVATILDGEQQGQRVDLEVLSDYGRYELGPQGGVAPNPLILEVVPDDRAGEKKP